MTTPPWGFPAEAFVFQGLVNGAPRVLTWAWPRAVAAALSLAALATAINWALRGNSGPFWIVVALVALFTALAAWLAFRRRD